MKIEYIIGIVIAATLVAGTWLVTSSPEDDSVAILGTTEFEQYKEIRNPSGFVNTEGISIEELIGEKVVLIDFMTYSCINCQRTWPFINTWYEKYKDQGLEIVGIHTPEFAFEKNIDNVEKAMAAAGIKFPIVLDNDYATWRAYGNQYWPRKYLIDIHGNIIYDHIGEGAYEETEKRIQEALEERKRVLDADVEISKDIADPEGAVDISKERNPRSPETYFGSLRNRTLANNTPGATGQARFALPESLIPSALYLDGVWNIQPEYAENIDAGASIDFIYTAKNVFLVMEADEEIVVDIYVDGNPVLEEYRGSDIELIDGKTSVRVEESLLYKLIEGPESRTQTLKIVPRTPGLRAFAFTFG